MQLHADARIPFPRETVFAAYRDDITRLLPFLPNVRAIEVKSRRDDGSRVEMVNEWRGGGDIPAAVRAVLGESVLSWTDYASWDGRTFSCAWRTETQAFGDAMKCQGQNEFVEDGAGATIVSVRGALDIDGRKIRGVPGFLAGTVGRAAEDFLASKIQANLLETAKGLERYLKESPPRS
jgi:uncharacterized protein YndB with AHSA1/START domain